MSQATAASVPEPLRRREIGRPRDGLTTPALILDLDVAEANIASMAEHSRGSGVALRPHIKVHKSSHLAQRQVDAGAIGITTATVWEAQAMARAGIDDLLIANQVVGGSHVRAVAELARKRTVMVAVDDAGNAARLAEAARHADSEIGVLVEVDTGMGRSGVRSAAEAVALGERVHGLDGVVLRGVSGYEGHCMLEPDPDQRECDARSAMDDLSGAAERMREAGLPCDVVSAGGTGTYHLTGRDPRITEIQAGSYVVMDAFHASLVPGGFAVALTVLATVISRQGGQAVLDTGRKAIGIDNMLPRLAGADAEPLFVHEEHSGFGGADAERLQVGDTVELEPGYAPTTANLHDFYHVVRDGSVVDLWPVEARYGAASVG